MFKSPRSLHRSRTILPALFLITFWGTAQAQRTIHVPADAITIQQAIDMASNGDTVSISPGTYYENINFKGKAITVTGAAAANASVIDGQAHAAVVTFQSGEGRNSVLSNLTIQNGAPTVDPEAGGVYVNGAAPTIRNNIIQNNFGCGIGSFSGAPLIEGNTITGTSQGGRPGCANQDPIIPTAQGSAIFLAEPSQDGLQPEIIANMIRGNTGYLSSAGLFLFNSGTPLVENNVITDNSSNEFPAMWIGAISNAPVIIQNLVYGNHDDSSQVQNAFAATPAVVLGGPTSGTPLIFANNTVVDNTVVLFDPMPIGSQLAVAGPYDRVQLYNNIIRGSGPISAVDCDSTAFPVLPFTAEHNDVYVSGSGATYQGTCPDPTGTNGNISVDPLFAPSSAGMQYPYQLQLQSPAVDSGDNNAPYLPTEDFMGNARIQNARGLSTSIVDMGVYEYPGVPALPPLADFALAVSPSSLTVTAGQQGGVTITLTPTSSFNGTVALSCGTLPADVSCTFQPQQVSLDNSFPQTAQLTLASASTVTAGTQRSTKAMAGVLLPGMLTSFWLLFPSRKSNRHLRRMLAIIMFLSTTAMITACGVHFNGSPATYSIAVYGTANAGKTSHQANVTLNVTPQ